MTRVPELLMPAGSPHKLRVAIEYGADAVYCGVPRYSLRARENEFRLHNLGEAVEFVRARGKKIYFTVNAIPRNSKVPGYLRYLKAMAEWRRQVGPLAPPPSRFGFPPAGPPAPP